MDDKNRTIIRPHKLIMEDCKKAFITGVNDVISFDLKLVLLETGCGMLTIKGDNLHVSRLSLEKGELDIDGRIDGISYAEAGNIHKKGQNLVGRLFK